MFVGKTSNGFEFEIDEDVFDDMEVIDYMADIEDERATSVTRLLRKVLGEDQKKRMYEHIKVGGRVSPETINEMITEIFNALGEKGKN